MVCAVVVAMVALSLGGGHRSANPEVLPPAPGPPVGGLCSAQLTQLPDGAVSPLFCANGDVNRLAWRYFAGKHLRVMGLGLFAADTDVAAAIRQDLSGDAGVAVECGAYRLATVYYGWGFAVDPAAGALTGCPIPQR